MPVVSVVIPTYNRAERLLRSVESVLKQTMSDTEVIIVDDGSTDDTPSLVKQLVGSTGKVKYARHEVNKGVSCARNTGIKLAKGKFVAFLDSDDLWHETKLETQLEAMYAQKADFSYTSIAFQDDLGNLIRVHRAVFSGYIFPVLLRKNVVGTASSVVVRTDLLKRVGLFNTSMLYREDYEMWLRISKVGKACAVERLLTTQIVHGGYRLSGDIFNRIRGFETIIKEFYSDYMKYKDALSKQLYELGKLYLKAGNYRSAVESFINSFKGSPSINAAVKVMYYLPRVKLHE